MTGLLTLSETAERLHVSTETLRKLYRHEGLPVVRVSANRYGVIWEDVVEWLRGRKMATWPGGSGEAAQSSKSAQASTPDAGEWQSASAGTRSASASEGRGSAARKRPPARNSAKSPAGSIVDFRPTRTA